MVQSKHRCAKRRQKKKKKTAATRDTQNSPHFLAAVVCIVLSGFLLLSVLSSFATSCTFSFVLVCAGLCWFALAASLEFFFWPSSRTNKQTKTEPALFLFVCLSVLHVIQPNNKQKTKKRTFLHAFSPWFLRKQPGPNPKEQETRHEPNKQKQKQKKIGSRCTHHFSRVSPFLLPFPPFPGLLPCFFSTTTATSNDNNLNNFFPTLLCLWFSCERSYLLQQPFSSFLSVVIHSLLSLTQTHLQRVCVLACHFPVDLFFFFFFFGSPLINTAYHHHFTKPPSTPLQSLSQPLVFDLDHQQTNKQTTTKPTYNG